MSKWYVTKCKYLKKTPNLITKYERCLDQWWLNSLKTETKPTQETTVE